MVKRLRGKAADVFEKKAKARLEKDENLSKSQWSALDSEASDQGPRNWDEEEQDYESMPRSFNVNSDEEVERLPVKGADGQIHRVMGKKEVKPKPSEEDGDESEEESEEDEIEIDEEEQDEEDEESKIPEEELLVMAQEKIADAAELLNEDPEEHIGKIRELRNLMSNTKSLKVKHITLLSLVPLFKDLIPGYRIRPLTDIEKKEKVSKDVRKLREFEESLVINYKEYIDSLAYFAKKGRSAKPGTPDYMLASASVMASCDLLESVPHFNFRNELIEIIIDKVSRKNIDVPFVKAISTIKVIFSADEEGHVSHEVVKLAAKMIKARKYNVHESVLDSFLHLRLLTELATKASRDTVERVEQPKIKKKDRVHLTKKQRKQRKKEKEIEEEMRKAETVVSAEEKERIQGETLKITFILYFNILKERSNSLMASTLEGLAKFAHLVNAEFFGDLLEVLRELILERHVWEVDGEFKFKESMTREALLCIVTAFTLLSGQTGESMNLDLYFFINHFYSALYSLGLNPDLEFSHKTLRLDDPLKRAAIGPEIGEFKRKVNISTEMEMVVKAFEFIFFRQRQVGKLRVEAFAKRLMVASLHMPERSAIAALKILDKMTKKFPTLSSLYSTDDRVANGIYRMDVDQPEHSNPEAATIWETIFLEHHYSPKVSRAATLVPKSAIVKN